MAFTRAALPFPGARRTSKGKRKQGMALTGELSDLSLAELIEFFCNQRKSGRLKLIYGVGPGYFYLRSGSVVHARIGSLRGVEAVYYALTLPNASFTFSPGFEAPGHTINQPWTSVVL